MIENVLARSELTGLARVRRSSLEFKTIDRRNLGSYLDTGWTIVRKNKSSVRISHSKRIGEAFEDRVWSLVFQLGFSHLSGRTGAKLQVSPNEPDGPTSQLDVVALDSDVAIAIECKAQESFGRRNSFQEELAKIASIRARFTDAVGKAFPTQAKRQISLVYFTDRVLLSDNDKLRAAEARVILLDEADLSYYESLSSHIGESARYQFLSDLMPHKPVPGLQIRVPAIRTRIAGVDCYTFSISPEYLLKIAYVSHRAKGKASDVNTYQRMINKNRLRRIRSYIEDGGAFPTNIVVSLDKTPLFEKVQQSGEQNIATLGWLDLKPSYKSAWIIDGQHRLFAYSGSSKVRSGRLSVLAFDNLPASRQAEMFIDINAQQKSVKQALLQELYAELHWESDDPLVRVNAIVSKIVQVLESSHDSPFFGRVYTADQSKSSSRSISFGSLFNSIDRPEFFISQPRKNGPPEYGPLWAGEDSEATRIRATSILNLWMQQIVEPVRDWWELGSGLGGGLGMNDGASACLGLLESVFDHLAKNGSRLVHRSTADVMDEISPYATIAGAYLASLSSEEGSAFRAQRGVQGVVRRRRQLEASIHRADLLFAPTGLSQWIEERESMANVEAKILVDKIELKLQSTVLSGLKDDFGEEGDRWWYEGIPLSIRTKAMQRHEEDYGKRGGKEFYLDLIDYRPIVLARHPLFSKTLCYQQAGNGKEKQTSWITEVNEVRRIVSHASSGQRVTSDQLSQVEAYWAWLNADELIGDS